MKKIALLVTVLALVATACGTDQELADVETVAAAAPVVAETAPSPDSGDVEGIKVHGHWTIEVRNPDGNLDERYEFENALTANGAVLLALLLSDPETSAGGPGRLGITPQPVSGPLGTNSCQLGILPVTQLRVGSTAVWSTNYTASSDGQIEAVTSCLGLATDAGEVAYGSFTEKILDTPIPVVAGQEVEITVEISFS